jgi:hypothetical protein
MKYKSMLVALALLMTSGAAMAAEKQQSLKEKYLENLALAVAVAGHCPTWTVDPAAATELMNFLKITIADISPEGKNWPVMEKYITGMRDVDEQTACKMAAGGFGPNGLVSPKMMIKKD